MDDLRSWLMLHRAPGVGVQRFRKLISQFGTPQNVLDNLEEAATSARLSSKTIKALYQPDQASIDRDLAWAEQDNNHVIVLTDRRYPSLLREIPDAPSLLFVSGNVNLLKSPQLAIVGSRNPSPDGRDNAFRFAKYLATSGLTISSGLALGIDAASHRGALAAKGKTLAVVGTGLDTVYPKRHVSLAEQIISDGGAVVSEFPTGTPALSENFPRRNRVISGLSMGCLVVEAAPRSGSLITARMAMEQGREVFAIPGSIHNPLAKGCHSLIKQGAKLVENAEDIFEELQSLATLVMTTDNEKEETKASTKTCPPEAEQLLGHLGYEPTPIDTLIERSGLTPDKVSSMLLVLELQGFVQSLAGGTYSRL